MGNKLVGWEWFRAHGDEVMFTFNGAVKAVRRWNADDAETFCSYLNSRGAK